MMDPIQEIYNIVCRHLGKPDNRNNIRVPQEHEKLLEEIQSFVSSYVAKVKEETSKQERNKMLWEIQKLYERV